MAENKKSFIVYTSWKLWLDGLSNEQKGIWLNWMMDYCNDFNPEYPKDQAIKIACMMAQDTLKRDLKKYEAKVKSIENARNQKKLTEINMKSSSNQSENSSVNVNVNDNVNDNVNEVNKLTTNNKNTNVFSAEVKEIYLLLPTISSSKGNQYPIYEEDINKYQSVYLGVDVKTELQKMKLWLEANPRSMKTYNGIPRFINNWLSREQDKAARTLKNNPIGNINDNSNSLFQELGESDEDYQKRLANGGFREL